MKEFTSLGVAHVVTLFLFFSLPLLAQPGTDVNGRNVTKVQYTENGGGYFITNGENTWTEVTVNGRHNFTESQRDDWSVYLRDEGRKISIQLDLWQKKIYLTADGNERFILYSLGEASVTQDITVIEEESQEEEVEATVEEVVWEIEEQNLNSIISWIKSRVASINVPYCYRDSYGRGAGSIPSGCANSKLEKDASGGPAGLCYPKCDSGYSGVGPLCWQSCPTNFRDDGAFCRKPDEYGRGTGRIPGKKPCSDWNAAYRDDGTSCWLDTYGRGVGRIPDKKPCSDWNAAYRDDGTSCWLDTYGRGTGFDYFFKDGMKNCEKVHGKGKCEMWGAIAYPKCKSGYTNVACCLCEPKGGPGIKVTAFQRYKCRSDEELNGALCYPKCKPGYKPVGCCLCEPVAGVGIKVTAFERYQCNNNEELNGALCYPKCKDGYHAVGCCICSYDCPPELGPDIGVSCTKKTYGRGVGELSTCPPNLIRDETGGPAGLCYPRCKEGFHGVGPVCWMDCPTGLTECGAGCAASDFDCGSTTFDQVFSVAIAAANIATMGLAKSGTAPLKAGQTAVKVGSKTFVTSTKIGKYSAKALAAIQQVDEGQQTGKYVVKYIKKKLHNPGAVIIETKSWTEDAYSAYKLYEEEFVNTDFINQTSADINRELDNKLHPEYAQTVKKYYARIALADFAATELDAWEIADYAFLAAGMADPTGIVDVAAAYAKPICDTVEPFPNLPNIYLK